jgi:glycosyltransferase involved in cell wall biosynthesis
MSVILHVITTLEGGGAESALRRLILADPSHAHQVVSLRPADGRALAAAGVPVHSLDMPAGRITTHGVLRLARMIRDVQPAVVQTWMYHADLFGGLVTKLTSRSPVCWGLRNAYLDADAVSRNTRMVARACAWLSHVVPAAIVSCSAVSARLHAQRGYARKKMRVIANGYDTIELTRDQPAGRKLRAAWGIPKDAFVFGMVARADAQKDHANLIAALGKLQHGLHRPWRCVLVGAGMTSDHLSLMRMLQTAGVRDQVVLAGAHDDVGPVMSALDLHVLSSRGEAFPNVIAEAMAHGTPCVATDVGDAALIVGETGWIVPPRDPERLAAAIADAATQNAEPDRWQARCAAARERIVSEFGIERMVRGYHDVWAEVGQPQSLPGLAMTKGV